MLSKLFRLKWKDINFLVRRRKYVPTEFFGFMYFDQYPNLKYNQISVNIPLKYNKKAVYRNILKRIMIKHIQEKELIKTRINWKFYKIFVTLNKKNITELKSQTEKFDKRDLNQYILREFENAFLVFKKRIWK